MRFAIVLILASVITSVANPQAGPAVLTVCELSRDFGAYRDKAIAVRGVYYYGLRQDCPEKCTHGLWPSFLDVRGADQDSWEALDKAQRTVEAEAKKGRRLEVWVTAVGQLRTRRRPGLDPCHRLGSRYLGYGHLGAYPAQLIVTQFRDIEVKVNPNSPYDYSNMYRGPL